MTQGVMTPPNPPSSPSTASSSGVARCWHSNAYFRYFLRYFSSTHRTDLSRFRGTFHRFDPVGFAIFAIFLRVRIRRLRPRPAEPPVFPDCITEKRLALISLLALKKIVPNLVQLEDCRLERRDKELLALTSHETKAIERFECIGDLEIAIDRRVFGEPRLDTACNLGRRWRYLRFADEVICKGRFLGFLVLGSGDQVVKNARIIVDIAEIDIFGELHVILQCLMLIFQPLAHGNATERHNHKKHRGAVFHVVAPTRPRPPKKNPRHKEQDGNRGVEVE